METKHTLAAAVAAGANGVSVYCRTCPNYKRFTNDEALSRWGTNATFPEIARRSMCSKCRQQGSEAAPQWPHPGGRAEAPKVIPKGWEDLKTLNCVRHP